MDKQKDVKDELVAPVIEVNRDAGKTLQEIKQWSGEVTNRVKELQSRPTLDADDLQRVKDELAKVGPKLQALQSIVEANTSSFGGGSDDVEIINRANMRLELDTDLPKMDRSQYNIMALTPD